MLFVFKNDQRGFTLTELLTALAVLWVVTGAVYGLLVAAQDIFNIDERQVDVQRSGRVALLHMAERIRECYSLVDTASYPSPPTDSYALTLRGIQVVKGNLTVDVANNKATSSYKPWLEECGVVVYKNGAMLSPESYTVDYTNGVVSGFSSITSSDAIQASFTRDVYLQYYVPSSEEVLKRRVVKISDGSVLEDRVIAKYVINRNKSPQVPLFTRDAVNSPSLIEIALVMDINPDEPPSEYRLEMQVRLRK